jgi:hypothetical protein
MLILPLAPLTNEKHAFQPKNGYFFRESPVLAVSKKIDSWVIDSKIRRTGHSSPL